MAGMFKYNEKQLWPTPINEDKESTLATLRPKAVLDSLEDLVKRK